MESSESNSINQNNDQVIDFTGSLVNTSSAFSIGDNILEGGIKSALNIGNIIVGNGQWIVGEETTKESLTSQAKADVDGRMNSLFDRLRDRLPLNDVEEESTGNPFTDENPFANGENPFGEGEFTPPPGYENSPLPSQDIVDDIKSVEDSNPTEDIQAEIPVVDSNPTEDIQAEIPVVDSNPTEDIQAEIPVVDSNSTEDIQAEIPVVDSNPTEDIQAEIPVVDSNPTEDIQAEIPVVDSNPTEDIQAEIPVVDSNPTEDIQAEIPIVDSNPTEDIQAEIPFAGGGEGENPFAGGEGGGNPFAGGEGGGNPFAGGGEGGGNPFAGGGEGENPFAGGEGGGNPFAGGEGGGNPFAGGEGGGNPFAGGEAGENPIAENDNGSSPSFDMLGMIFGEDLPFLNASEGDDSYSTIPNQSTNETLKVIRNSLLIFNAKLNLGSFGDANDTPLQTANDLLTLFRNDMFSFNNSANSFQGLVDDDNPFSSGEYNPFGEGTLAEEIPFDILNVALDGLLPFNGSENVFSTPEGEIPIGNGNQDFGYDNAVIGNANWNYGNLNATIGNGNWNWDDTAHNSTVGNGNWHLDFTADNKTVGNGNWYWDSSNENTTLGNGNWLFGNNNTTIGNGNWDFGNNNTVIGNGNRVYTDNSIVIGNGNWSVVIDKSATIGDDLLGELETIAMGIGVKKSADMLVDSVMSKMGEIFQPLTEEFDESTLNTYNQQILSSDSGIDFLISA